MRIPTITNKKKKVMPRTRDTICSNIRLKISQMVGMTARGSMRRMRRTKRTRILVRCVPSSIG
jgi:hypothetical protein